jgi:hypothetical protein
MAAIHRHTTRQTLLQMHSLRIAARGGADDVARFRAEISGEAAAENDETDAALAAFGLTRAS